METAAKRVRDKTIVLDGLLDSFTGVPSDAQKQRLTTEDRKPQRWTPEEDEALRVAVEKHGQRNWKLIAAEVEGRNHGQCQQRWNKVLKPGLVKGHWSEEEDAMLKQMALQGCHSWTDVAAHIPGRTPKQCRERWRNHLDPSINRAPFTPEEDFTIQQAYEQMGNRWTKIAELVPGRTEDAVKTRWKTLNPFRKTNDRPGRPRRMPGVDDVGPLANSGNVMASGLHAPAYAHAYDTLASMLLSMAPSQVAAPGQVGVASAAIGSELPEPIVEPPHDGSSRSIDSKDAAILKEILLKSHSSLMSFGSARDVSSFADISPDELLASGELDEMLKAVSISNDGDPAMTSFPSLTSAKALIETLKKLSKSDDNPLFHELEEKHIFQELIDTVRAATGETGDDASNRSLDIFTTSSGRDLLHPLVFDESSIRTTSAEVGALDGEDEDEEDDDEEEEDDEDDLLKPFHICRRSPAKEDDFEDLLKTIHVGKRTSLVGPPDGAF